MGRPQSASFKTFHLFDKLHTVKTKMYCGVESTTLYAIKETKKFFLSPEVWAYCASKFRKNKKDIQLSVDIPELTDEKAIEFLKDECWTDWVDREVKDGNSEIIEGIALLKRIFPDKNCVYFYELNSLIAAYNQGTFLSYDKDGNIKPLEEYQIERQKGINHKYNFSNGNAPELVAAREKWTSEKDEKKRSEYLTEFSKLSRDYSFKNNNLINVFIEISKKSVCYPAAFSKGTADWYKKEYGKKCGYSEAGEIFFVSTPDTVYFEITRHY